MKLLVTVTSDSYDIKDHLNVMIGCPQPQCGC